MTLGALTVAERRARLRQGTLRLRIGPFVVAAASTLRLVDESLTRLYPDFEIAEEPGCHFAIDINAPSLLRNIVRPQVRFTVNHRNPFIPLPQGMAALLFEAGLNWAVGMFANQFIVVHSATLEQAGRGLLMPAIPGSGKSTLCAALVARGWRLLSDEFALLDPSSGELVPVPRPIALKERSIDLIRQRAPGWVFGPLTRNNEGQVVSYVRAPAESVSASRARALPQLIVHPRYDAGSDTAVTPMSRAQAVLHLADNSFNYNFHGRTGFERLVEIADRAVAVRLRYSRLDEGVAAIEHAMAG